MSVRALLHDIDVQYARIWSGWSKRRFPAASAPAIEAFEKTLGHPLPADFRELLLLSTTEHPLHGGYVCSPLDGIIADWHMMKSLLDAGTFDDGRVGATEPAGNWDSGKLAKVWWHAGWVPFAVDGCGNMVCVDLAPGPKGVVGQLVKMEVQDGQGPFASDFASVEQLLAHHLELVRTGRYKLEDDGYILSPDRYRPPRG